MAAAATGRAEEWHQGENGGRARFACLACLAWARRARDRAKLCDCEGQREGSDVQ